jgi:transcriptional regulator with XRE-family HTH domain
MNRKVDLSILKEWAKGKRTPGLELALKAEIAEGTARKLFRGECPKTQKVRVKISSAIGVDEDMLFPSNEDIAA